MSRLSRRERDVVAEVGTTGPGFELDEHHGAASLRAAAVARDRAGNDGENEKDERNEQAKQTADAFLATR